MEGGEHRVVAKEKVRSKRRYLYGSFKQRKATTTKGKSLKGWF